MPNIPQETVELARKAWAKAEKHLRGKVSIAGKIAIDDVLNASATQQDEERLYRQAFYDGAEWALEHHPSGSKYEWPRFTEQVRAHLAACKQTTCPECGDSGEIVLGEPEGRHERVACMHPSHDSKPAPEAGEAVEHTLTDGWSGTCTDDCACKVSASHVRSIDEATPQEWDAQRTCTPAPPAVCEACADPVYRPNPYKPHTCKPSGA